MENKKVIVANRWMTPDGTVLESRYDHDYVAHQDSVSGEYYFVDGGISYIRTSSNTVPMKDCCLWSTDNIGAVRKFFRRGTFDKDGERLWVLMKNLSDKHIQNIVRDLLDKGADIMNPVGIQYIRELAYRFEKDEHVEEHDYTHADE